MPDGFFDFGMGFGSKCGGGAVRGCFGVRKGRFAAGGRAGGVGVSFAVGGSTSMRSLPGSVVVGVVTGRGFADNFKPGRGFGSMGPAGGPVAAAIANGASAASNSRGALAGCAFACRPACSVCSLAAAATFAFMATLVRDTATAKAEV